MFFQNVLLNNCLIFFIGTAPFDYLSSFKYIEKIFKCHQKVKIQTSQQ